jgi:hypothetical protein
MLKLTDLFVLHTESAIRMQFKKRGVTTKKLKKVHPSRVANNDVLQERCRFGRRVSGPNTK